MTGTEPSAAALRDDVVYRVRSTDPTVSLALKPHLFEDELRWFDTVRGRVKPGRLLESSPRGFVWETPEAVRYEFSVLGLDEYRRDLREQVEGGLDFPDEAAMHAFFVTERSF